MCDDIFCRITMRRPSFLFISFFGLLLIQMSIAEMDLLEPYTMPYKLISRHIRDTQQCQHSRYGNTTYSLHKVHRNQSALSHVVDIHHQSASVGEFYYSQRLVSLRYQRVYNPQQTFSVVEPGGWHNACGIDSGLRATVQETARSKHCIVAANGGFFNTHTGQCLGNIVSDGRLVQSSGGIQNVHFGITKDGQIFTGFLSEIQLLTMDFVQLVGGVIWLLRDGEVYVDESRKIECPDTEETGTLDRFIDVMSARTAVGHDAEGHVLMAQVDGRTDIGGVDLHAFAEMLKKLGFVNAINLDGGGSATSVLNGTLVNYPSDTCPNSTWNCARAVSTALCVHQASCSPDPYCSHRGNCVSGHCQCHSPWTGDFCNFLMCPGNCSGHGWCSEDGCECEAGWEGEDCSVACRQGSYGVRCSHSCLCLNGAACDPASGFCYCAPGFIGTHCQSTCGYGFYGHGCRNKCPCQEECFCHPVTGECSNKSLNPGYHEAGQCLAVSQIKRDNLVPDQSDQLQLWRWLSLTTGILAFTSIALNIWLASVIKSSHQRSPHYNNNRRQLPARRRFPFLNNASSDKDYTELVPLHSRGVNSNWSTGSSDEVDDMALLFGEKSSQSR